ncbi:hypothetical protein V8F44DRAFT_487932 [Aspergillus fumigatus]
MEQPLSWPSAFPVFQCHRFYRTKDLVRYNPAAGDLQNVCREDNQVKNHGQQIELATPSNR